MKSYKHAWTYDDSNYKAWNTYTALNYDANLDAFNDTYQILIAKMIRCTIPAVKSLFKSIVLSKAKHYLQYTL
ncbi:unnamed protein product, partial [Rotaria sp. Silwood1]